MAEPGRGRVEQARGQAAKRGELPHQQEERHHRKRIGRVGGIGQVLELGGNGIEAAGHRPAAEHADGEHGNADRHAQEDQDEDGRQAQEAKQQGGHSSAPARLGSASPLRA